MSGALQAGDVFAGYRIEGILGRGGMGVVYRAEDLHLGRTVALKILAPERAGDPSFRERFLRESRLLASIDHRNIVDVFHADEVDGVLFLAMRFIDGFDLGALLRREGRLAPASVAHIIREAAEALDEAHSHGLVHRDVKPGNVLISLRGRSLEQARVYLSDFGLTKRAGAESQLTTAGQFLGTPAYVAPEQIQGATVDGRADLYALACVAYECLAGAPPYHEAGEAAVLMAHLVAPPPDLAAVRPDLPPAAGAAIARGMAKSRDQRHERCADFAAELAAALAEVPVVEADGPAQVEEPAVPPAPAAPDGPPAAPQDEEAADRTRLVAEAEPATLLAAAAVDPAPAGAPTPELPPPAVAPPAAAGPPPATAAGPMARPSQGIGWDMRTTVGALGGGRRRRAVLGAGGLGVALVAAAAVAFSGLGPAGPPGPSPGSSPAAAASPTVTVAGATATANESRPFPDPEETVLLTMVPSLVRASCGRADSESPGPPPTATLECRPTGHLAPTLVRYRMYSSDSAVEEAYAAWLANVQLQVGLRNEPVRCTRPPHNGGYGDYTHFATPGRMICHLDADGRALFTWSVKVLRVLSEAVRDDGNAAELYEWWSNPDRSGPLG